MKKILFVFFMIVVGSSFCTYSCCAQNTQTNFKVIAYYSGDSAAIDGYAVQQLTHIIYSFCHLKGNRLRVDNQADTATIQKLVKLKQTNRQLKVLLSLGGWGGCKTCSDVFSTHEGRAAFAASVKDLALYFHTDGIDLDWEYPAIQGPPGHPFQSADKDNFTELIKSLRETLGKNQEISFAAGGFPEFLQKSIDWDKVMPLVDYVNLMNYDMVNGNTPHTGHHTPLYSTNEQEESVHACVNYLSSIGVPKHKMIIGAAFYGRSWEQVNDINHGLYQPGRFSRFIPYRVFEKEINERNGFSFYNDSKAKAAYAYNKERKVFVTFDDSASIQQKTQYALTNDLGGIMFWELSLDKKENGYLGIIHKEVERSVKNPQRK